MAGHKRHTQIGIFRKTVFWRRKLCSLGKRYKSERFIVMKLRGEMMKN